MSRGDQITVLDVAGWRSRVEGLRGVPPGAVPAFGEAVASITDGTDAGALLVERSSGSLLVPFVRTADAAESTSFGMSSGPVTLDGDPGPLEPGALRSTLGVDHFVGYIHHTLAPIYERVKTASRHTTHVVRLDDKLGSAYKKRAKSNLKTASKAGVEVRIGSPSEAGLLTDILVAAAAGAGRPLFPDRRTIRRLAESELALLVFGMHAGKEVAASLFLDSPLELFYWLSGTLPDANELMPSYAMVDTAARTAHERGRDHLNMGSSDGLPGVAHFKEGFGAERVPYPAIAASSMRRRLTHLRARIDPRL